MILKRIPSDANRNNLVQISENENPKDVMGVVTVTRYRSSDLVGTTQTSVVIDGTTYTIGSFDMDTAAGQVGYAAAVNAQLYALGYSEGVHVIDDAGAIHARTDYGTAVFAGVFSANGTSTAGAAAV